MNSPLRRSERVMVLLVGAVQFVNILDFMMVMPLGPDFAGGLGVPMSHLGYIGGSYTAAAALAGLVGSFFLDRFDRRPALVVAMLGLGLGTAAGGLATGLGSLIAARVVAGMFGGPATSLAMSIIADVIPPERRGRAMGAVMGAFSVASVLGVPAGLELARLGTWRTPFFAVAGLGLVLTLAVAALLPPLRGHLDQHAPVPFDAAARQLFGSPTVRFSYAMTASAMMGGFILIPNIAAYLQQNLGYPRERLGLLYMCGGALSFVGMNAGGRLIDALGPTRVAAMGTGLLAVTITLGFIVYQPGWPVLPGFVAFMLCMSLRNVSLNTVASMVPPPALRARFMSLQSMVAHLASASGAFLSSRLLTEGAGATLIGIERIAGTSIFLTMCTLPLMMAVERGVRRAAAAAGATASEPVPEPLPAVAGPGR